MYLAHFGLTELPFGLTPDTAFAFATRDAQIITLIHEMAHYLGDPDGAPNSIDDPPGGSSASSEIAKLPARLRPRIAENYATFAFEAHFRRPPFRILA